MRNRAKICLWQTGGVALVILLIFSVSVANCTTATTADTRATPSLKGTVRITGAGTTYPALEALARAYEAKNRGVRITFLPNNQTTGGIIGTQEGVASLGAVTRPPKPEEAGGRLNYAEFAKDALLLATHPSVSGVTNLRIEDIRAIYSGKIRNWKELGGPDAGIIVLDRPEDESAKILLRQYFLGLDLVISPSAVNLKQEADLIVTLRDTPFSVGAFSLAYAVSNGLAVTRLAIDGVAPSPENVRTGRYGPVRTLGIVWLDDAPAVAQAFRSFILSDEGGRVLEEKGYAPSSSSP